MPDKKVTSGLLIVLAIVIIAALAWYYMYRFHTTLVSNAADSKRESFELKWATKLDPRGTSAATAAAITIGKMIAEPENVSALTAVTNNMIQTFLLFFSCRYQTAHMRTAGIAILARMAFPS